MRHVAIVIVAAMIACATPPAGHWVRTELYFGADDQNGALVVNDTAWQSFVDTVVTPRFPQGLTVLSGNGQWQGSGRLVHEPSRVLILLHPPSPRADVAIDEIRAIYRQRFSQESVLKVSEPANVSF